MKLIVTVEKLDLIQEKEQKVFGDVLEMEEERAQEILNYRFKGLPVAIKIPEDEQSEIEIKGLETKIQELESANSSLVEEIQKLKDANADLEKEKNKIDVQDKKGKGDK